MILIRKRKTKYPCSSCGLNPELCLCAEIPKLTLRTKLCLIIHHRELKRTTNTGRLALKSLTHSEIRIRGEKNKGALDLSDLLIPSFRTVLFYPSEEAQELTPEFVNQSQLPIQLLVPDGNWRQASKVSLRHPELQNIERVKITAKNTATQHLRVEHFSEGMSTLEAIAQALGVIEGAEIREALLKLYQLKLARTLKGRGVVHLLTHEVPN